MKTNRRKFVKTGLASAAGVAFAGKLLLSCRLPAPKVSELTKLDGNHWLIASNLSTTAKF